MREVVKQRPNMVNQSIGQKVGQKRVKRQIPHPQFFGGEGVKNVFLGLFGTWKCVFTPSLSDLLWRTDSYSSKSFHFPANWSIFGQYACQQFPTFAAIIQFLTFVPWLAWTSTILAVTLSCDHGRSAQTRVYVWFPYVCTFGSLVYCKSYCLP